MYLQMPKKEASHIAIDQATPQLSQCTPGDTLK
jgi:hypothetical protein